MGCLIADYGSTAGEYRFEQAQPAADTRGEIAIGLRRHGSRRNRNGGMLLNPCRDEVLELGARANWWF
jgi:hypothetical protein